MSVKRPAENSIDEVTQGYVQLIIPSTETTTKQRTIIEVKRDENGPVLKMSEVASQQPKGQIKSKETPKGLFLNLFNSDIPKSKPKINPITTPSDKTALIKAFHSNIQIPQHPITSDKYVPQYITFINMKKPSGQLKIQDNAQSKHNGPKNPFANFDNRQNPFANYNNKESSGSDRSPAYSPYRRGGDDQDQLSAQLQKIQHMKVDKSKSTGHYDYKAEVELLFLGNAKKYKKDKGEIVENVQVLLQRDHQTNFVYLIVRMPVTKHSIFTGLVLRKRSQVRVLHSRAESLEILAAIFKEGQVKIHKIKVQLDSPENGKILLSNLEAAIEDVFGKEEAQKGDEKQAESKVEAMTKLIKQDLRQEKEDSNQVKDQSKQSRENHKIRQAKIDSNYELAKYQQSNHKQQAEKEVELKKE